MGAEKTTIQVKIEFSVDRQDQRGVWSLCLQVDNNPKVAESHSGDIKQKWGEKNKGATLDHVQ